MFYCQDCNQIFSENWELNRHKKGNGCEKYLNLKNVEKETYKCISCCKTYRNNKWFKKHIINCYSRKDIEEKKIINNIGNKVINNITNNFEKKVTNNQITNKNITNNNYI